MGIEEALALIALMTKLIPAGETVYASIKAAVNGTATQADVDAIMAATVALNAQVDADELAAGATG